MILWFLRKNSYRQKQLSVVFFFFFFFLEHPNYEQKRNSRLIVIRSKVQKYELLKIEIPVNNTLLFEDRKREKEREGEREIDN